MLQKKFEKTGAGATSQNLMRMDRQIDNLNQLVHNLLDVSRLEKGGLAFQYTNFDVNELVQEVISTLQTTTNQHKIILQGKVDRPVWGDRFRIAQVLVNLFTNAIKYSPNATKIIIRLAIKDTTALVEVEDFGIGISKEHQQDIFKRFYRVNDSPERTYPGLGIGLYISYEIIKKHGGTITLYSKKGKGSRFTFTIPLELQTKEKKGYNTKAKKNGELSIL